MTLRYHTLHLILILYNIHSIYSLKIYESTYDLHDKIKDKNDYQFLRYLNNTKDNDLNWEGGLTACLRFNYKKIVPETNSAILWIGIFEEDERNLENKFRGIKIIPQFPVSYFEYKNENTSFYMTLSNSNKNSILSVNRWHHLCIEINPTQSQALVVLDGILQNKKENMKHLDKTSIAMDSIYLFASNLGEITDFNLWNKPLSLEKLQGWTNCSQIEYGNIINWNEANWVVSNMKDIFRNYTNICQNHEIMFLPNTDGWTTKSAGSICKGLKGSVYVEDTESKKNLVVLLAKSSPFSVWKTKQWGNLTAWWNGWSDERIEGKWTSLENSTRPIDDSEINLWAKGGIDGQVRENCAISVMQSWLNSDNVRWYDWKCSDNLPALCEVPRKEVFILRGLCSTSSFDTHYGWPWFLKDNTVSFLGFEKSILKWNSLTNEWRISIYDNPYTYAYLNGSFGSVFGTGKWHFINDTCEEIEGNVFTSQLSFSRCMEDEFSCEDGTCINFEKVCDGLSDCAKSSDESDCSGIILEDMYDYKHSKNENLKINISVQIEDILDLDEIKGLMTAKFTVKLNWLDRYTKYVNLNKNENLNILKMHQKKELWMPTLFFSNAADNNVGSFIDDLSIGRIILIDQNINGTFSPLSDVKNHKQYNGHEGILMIEKSFILDLECQLFLAMYPLDQQTCKIEIKPDRNNGHLITLLPMSLNFDGGSVNQYQIDKWELKETSNNKIIIHIEFTRQRMYFILNVILPIILINVICFATNYMADEHFDTIVAVNLTGLLVMVTLFNDATTKIPATSYMKLFDIWQFVSVSIPFAEVLLHIAIDNLTLNNSNSTAVKRVKPLFGQDKISEKDRNTKKLTFVRNFATYGISAFYCLFIVTFFTIPLFIQ